jgi:shikimate kinase
MKNIILVGFMGTGKTVVGRALAKRLGMRFVDMDDIIEEREGMKISDIFENRGEEYFRRAEKMVAKDIAIQSGVVVSAGGGAVIDEENVKNFKSGGVIFCLAAAPERILERTKGHLHRPLLNVGDPKEKIAELLAKRAGYYARADYRIDTTDLSVEQVVEKIVGIMDSV